MKAGAQSRLEREAEGPLPDSFNPSDLEAARQQDLPKSEQQQQEQQEQQEQTTEEHNTEDSTNPVEIPDLQNLPKKAQDWKSLKEKHNAEKLALEQKIQELSSSPNEELEQLRKQNEEYKQALRETAIERDPEFNSKYQTQADVAIRNAKLAAADRGDELAKLLEMPSSVLRDQQIDKIIEELPNSSQRRINAALSTLEQIDISKQAEIAAARQNWDARIEQTTQQQQQARQQQQQARQTAFDKHLAKLQADGDDGYFAYQAGNSKASEAIELAKRVISGDLGPEEEARVALTVGASGQLFELVQSQQSEIEQLQAKLSKFESSVPGNGVKEPAATDLKQKDYYDKGYSNDFMSGLRAAQNAQ
jgi:hypothetical protein